MNPRQESMRNHTHGMNLGTLGKRVWVQVRRKTDCIWYNGMTSKYSMLLSPSPFSLDLHTPPQVVALSISVIPVLSYTPCHFEWQWWWWWWWWWETDFLARMASKWISMFSPSVSRGALPFTLQHRLHPDHPYIYIDRELDQYYITYYEVANLVTETEKNMIDEMACGNGTLRTTAVRIWQQVSCRAVPRSQLLQILTIL